MDVSIRLVATGRNLGDVRRISHIQNAEGTRRTCQGDPFSLVIQIGTAVGDHLSIVHVGLAPTPHQNWIIWG